FGYMMAIMRIPAKVTEFFVAISSDKYTFLLYVNVLLLLLGTFMDLAPMLLICTPIFLPVIKTFGIDPVQFGIIMILNLGIGLLTPPVGPTMVVGCAIGRVSMEAVSRSILIFYVPMLIVLLLVTYIPALPLCRPSVLLKGAPTAASLTLPPPYPSPTRGGNRLRSRYVLSIAATLGDEAAHDAPTGGPSPLWALVGEA